MVEQTRRKVPFLFGEDNPNLAGKIVFGELMTMNFAEMRESQNLFESNLKGTDAQLAALNEPFYLLTRGVLGETEEALKALKDPHQGVDSMAFKSEMVDILVFIGSLLNHTDVSEAELHDQLAERLVREASPKLESLLAETIPFTAAQAAALFVEQKQEVTPAFREALVLLAELVIRALQQTNISPEELNFHFAQVVIKNFIKYRPEIVSQYLITEGMAISRANFKKNEPGPITDANLAEKQHQWAEGDASFARRQKQLLRAEKTQQFKSQVKKLIVQLLQQRWVPQIVKQQDS